jgi:6-phosphogluconolactonase
VCSLNSARPPSGDPHRSARSGRPARLPGHPGAAMIQVYPDLESLSRAAAGLLVTQANLAVADRGRFSVALAGGNTPRRTYELLATPPFSDQAPWDRVHVFWGDERGVPLTDLRSNARLAKEAWLDRVPIPPDQIHPLNCTPDPVAAARQYEAELRKFFAGQPPRLDLVLLGLGDDGHTASLFPGTSVLKEDERWVAGVYLAPPGLNRVTLTAPLINQAAVVAFLVAGRAKAGVLREVLHGPRDPARLPAQLIQPSHGALLWLADREAAALIPAGEIKLGADPEG